MVSEMSHTDSSPAALPAPPRRVVVIYNPTAGRNRRKRLTDVLDRLAARGLVVSTRETGRRGDAEEFARLAALETPPCDVIVAAGGDGTINEVVNGMAGCGPGTPMLAIIPLGTANVLACEIGLDVDDSDQIAETIASGTGRTVHLGTANGRHFVLMAGIGLDAKVVEGINANVTLKRRTGKFAYVVEGVRQALGYDFPALEVRADGKIYRGRMAVACRGRYYGGPYVAAPAAKLEEPRLEVCILPKKGMSGALRYGLALPFGKLSSLPEVEMVSTRAIVVNGPRGAPVQADGDIVARLPAEITVATETVDLVVPAGFPPPVSDS